MVFYVLAYYPAAGYYSYSKARFPEFVKPQAPGTRYVWIVETELHAEAGINGAKVIGLPYEKKIIYPDTGRQKETAGIGKRALALKKLLMKIKTAGMIIRNNPAVFHSISFYQEFYPPLPHSF